MDFKISVHLLVTRCADMLMRHLWPPNRVLYDPKTETQDDVVPASLTPHLNKVKCGTERALCLF